MAGQLLLARGAHGVVGRQPVDQRPQPGGRIRHDRTRRLLVAAGLLRVDIEPHDLQRRVQPPLALLLVEPGADPEHHVRLRPQPARDRVGDRQTVAGRDDAPPAPVGRDRRLQHLGQQLHLGPGIRRAAADDDERPFRRPEQPGHLVHRLRIDRRHDGRDRPNDRRGPGLLPHVDRAFQRHRPLAAGQRRQIAFATRADASCGPVMRAACLVTRSSMPSWSGVSCRWP